MDVIFLHDAYKFRVTKTRKEDGSTLYEIQERTCHWTNDEALEAAARLKYPGFDDLSVKTSVWETTFSIKHGA
jgi:hypothetical protein